MLQDFLNYLNEQAENGSIYVWGAQGQAAPTITEQWIRNRETSKTNANRAIKLWKKRVAEGYGDRLRAFDCSGLGVYWLLCAGVISSDMTANGLRGKCTAIQKSHLKPGDWVFKCNASGRATHIGYVVDRNLNVVEAKGREDGVVRRPLSKGGWNAYGRPKCFAEEIDSKEERTEHASFNRVLRQGMKGDDVRELQKLLNAAGDDLKVDGDFGSQTLAAVKAFQKRKKLAIDGKAGRNTITALGGVWAA